MKTVTREELQKRIERGDDFLLLEVLCEASYNREHLPGAVRYEGQEQVYGLVPDRSAEIVAYCSDFN